MSKGRCFYCERIYSKAGIIRHLSSCEKRNAIAGANRGTKASFYHTTAQGSPEYWMHLRVLQEAKLYELDRFLRDVWVECCGHLSAFIIEGRYYSSYPDSELDDSGMDEALSDVTTVGAEFSYEYDFGTTTTLLLKVVCEMEEVPKGDSIQIMARNEAPLYACSVCGAEAALICTQCIYEYEALYCATCAQNHECGEEMLLPIVNSPRVGVCGYTGSGSLKRYFPA
jgi:hypothetical protein